MWYDGPHDIVTGLLGANWSQNLGHRSGSWSVLWFFQPSPKKNTGMGRRSSGGIDCTFLYPQTVIMRLPFATTTAGLALGKVAGVLERLLFNLAERHDYPYWKGKTSHAAHPEMESALQCMCQIIQGLNNLPAKLTQQNNRKAHMGERWFNQGVSLFGTAPGAPWYGERCASEVMKVNATLISRSRGSFSTTVAEQEGLSRYCRLNTALTYSASVKLSNRPCESCCECLWTMKNTYLFIGWANALVWRLWGSIHCNRKEVPVGPWAPRSN